MVKHIVLFKLTAFSNNMEKESQLKQLNEIFSVLPNELDYIAEYRTGTNFTAADHAWDFAIDSAFNCIDDLVKYQMSREHLEAIKRAGHINKIKAVVDYEF